MEEIYQRTSIFRDLTNEDFDKIQKISQRIIVAKNQTVFSEGDLGDTMYLIERGRIKLTHIISLGIEKTILVLEEGNLFGEMALITTGSRSATATAEEETSLLAFKQEPFFKLIKEDTQLGIIILRNILHLLSDRLRITTNGYIQSIAWGLEVAGAASLNLDKVIKDQLEIEINCINDVRIIGRLIKVEKNGIGLDLLIKDSNNKIIMVPYHAIVTIDISYGGFGLL